MRIITTDGRDITNACGPSIPSIYHRNFNLSYDNISLAAVNDDMFYISPYASRVVDEMKSDYDGIIKGFYEMSKKLNETQKYVVVDELKSKLKKVANRCLKQASYCVKRK